ncbi:MAG: hypothetical protein Q7K03_09335 [Dehalococcoidia bacterium]|nr:hypothetical protein [Dehalococcoidia bacterium]
MNAVLFGLTYLYSWLLMGLGVFLAFRVATDLRRAMQQRAIGQERTLVASGAIRIALIALVVLVSMGVTYAGAYTVYNLMIAG